MGGETCQATRRLVECFLWPSWIGIFELLVPFCGYCFRLRLCRAKELPDETWAAFEIKLGSTKSIDEAAANLQKLPTRLTPEKAARCVSLNVLIAGTTSYTRKDNVNVISLGHLFAKG